MALTYKYGTYDFSPGPMLAIKTEALKTPDGSGYGRVYDFELNGSLILTGAEVGSGTVLLFKKIGQLKDALNYDGQLFVIACDNTGIISGYPTIEEFNINDSPDQYTRQAEYNITFKMSSISGGSGADPFNGYNTFPPYIKSFNETWDIDFADERLPVLFNGEQFGYKVAVSHSIEVEARIHYTGATPRPYSNTPWEDALTFASGKLGYDTDIINKLSGVIGFPGTGFTTTQVFNQFRKVGIDKTNGRVTVDESFILTPTGNNVNPHNAIETFDISTDQTDGVVKVVIKGNIEGLASVSYPPPATATGFGLTESKYKAASGYFNVIKPKLFSRASSVYEGLKTAEPCYLNPLNSLVRSKQIGVNPIEGTIDYSYEFDTAPVGCITGDCILSQNISIEDSLPTDVFAKQTVLGRALGPILQDIGTVTEGVRNLNIEIAVLPPSSCASISQIYNTIPTGQLQNLIDTVYNDLTGQYEQVFVSSNSQNWNFTVGRYSRTIGFTYAGCSG